MLKYTVLLVCVLLYQTGNILAGTCEREEGCSNNCALVCKNTTETEVRASARGYDKLIVQYGSLKSVGSLFLSNPNLVKVLEIRENENDLRIQESQRPLTQECGLEELTLEKNSLELLFESKLFDNFNKLKKLSIHECYIERVFYNLFQNLPSLEYLSLRSNGIIEIDNHAFYRLKNLKYVDLSENLIKSLSYENFKVTNGLQEFYMNQNPLYDFNLEKFLRDKPKLWMANMHSIYCNTFRYAIMDSYQKLGYEPTYLRHVECSTPHFYYKCNAIIMKDSNKRNITIAEIRDNNKEYQTYYENNINEIFLCLDDCSTQLIGSFREGDEYAEQLAANILQYHMAHLQKNFKDFYLRYDYMEHVNELQASLEKLQSVINVTSLQIEGKL
ncbi:uncharacterized protein LOC123297262 [Chrysoperla carnea]|uniref:uncharacterized protein LOC123297262 n=1 Tax=Chrysoperla carnea TaxID=189513 RepID=UPI001D08CAC2|nr:uncharacterized protein LOC123297262 [Chrysoperla carnea]